MTKSVFKPKVFVNLSYAEFFEVAKGRFFEINSKIDAELSTIRKAFKKGDVKKALNDSLGSAMDHLYSVRVLLHDIQKTKKDIADAIARRKKESSSQPDKDQDVVDTIKKHMPAKAKFGRKKQAAIRNLKQGDAPS